MHDLMTPIKEISRTTNIFVQGFKALSKNTKIALGITVASVPLISGAAGPVIAMVSGEAVTHSVGTVLTGSAVAGLVATLALAPGVAASTILGITAAREKQIKAGALGGVCVGLGLAGGALASSTLLGSSTVLPVMTKPLLQMGGIGGAGGALLAILAARAAISGEVNNLFMLGGTMLGLAVAGTAIPESLLNPSVTGAVIPEGLLTIGGPSGILALPVAGLIIGGVSAFYIQSLLDEAIYIDNALLQMIENPELPSDSEIERFNQLLEKKLFFLL